MSRAASLPRLRGDPGRPSAARTAGSTGAACGPCGQDFDGLLAAVHGLAD
ncbi:MAG: hypothetical protein ACRDP5_07295 [Streptosporangiaceae bacterium]